MTEDNAVALVDRARTMRKLVGAPLAILAVVLLSSCYADTVPAPVGVGPLRYRDQVFASYDLTSNVSYGTAPDRNGNPVNLVLDLYTPTGDAATGRPAIVFAHGGSFIGGTKTSDQAATMAQAFAKRGYVTVSINYRLLANPACSGGSSGSTNCITAAVAGIEDGEAAVRWVRANASTLGVDPAHVGISGVSAGAIIATGVAILGHTATGGSNPGYSSEVQGFVSISGGFPTGGGVDANTAPGFLFSGTADSTVPYQWSYDTAHAMDAAGVRVVFNTLNGAGHVPFGTYGGLFDTQSTNFFYQVLDAAGAPQ